MIGYFIVQLPFSVCIIWCLLLIRKSHKSHSDRLMIGVFTLMAITFFCGSCQMDPFPKYDRLVVYRIIMQYSSLAIFPFAYFYLRSWYVDRISTASAFVMLLPSLLSSTSNVVVSCLLGISHCAQLLQSKYSGSLYGVNLDTVENAYIILNYGVYQFLFFLSVGLSLVYVFYLLFSGKFKLGHIPAFLKGQKASFVANVICMFLFIFYILWGICIIFSSVFMDTMSVWSLLWSVVTSLVLFIMGYVAAVPPLPGGYVSLQKLRRPLDSSILLQQADTDNSDLSAQQQTGYDKIMDSFQELMVKNEGFLDPDMTIDEISRRLNSNRTYVSKLVNQYHGMPFRDYLNKLRMDYAKQLMLDEPDASIEYIAAKSGFQGSTQFIRKFKEHESVTPAAWRTAQLQKKQ